ncbi:hypothetical protein HmCmsJML070_03912 [Escherichia coli]|uniref:hypothetical protein n=1 Tax=Escherichia coli TaxID=562 RepID=UPI0010CB0767|nr:hypothetical protein [Escherichia coli]EFH6968848.1 hypothetical protein [Escherichia coli]GCY72653.1 hypothetical protein HmCmsJML070_03912 [Escherichia coli]
MSEVHTVTIQLYDLIIDLQTSVNDALENPTEFNVGKAVLNLESMHDAMLFLIEACEAGEGSEIDADDLAGFNLMLADCSTVVSSAIEDLQPLINNLIASNNNGL